MSFRDKEPIDLIMNTIEADLFRYIVVQYNLFPAVKALKTALETAFPQQKLVFLSIVENGYDTFMQKLYAFSNEIVIVPDFDLLLENDTWRIAFNQQRDKLSLQHKVNLLACIPDEKRYFELCTKGMADFWSIRHLSVRLDVEFERVISDEELLEMIMQSYYPINKKDVEKEIGRINKRLEELEDNLENNRLINELLFQKLNLKTLINYNELLKKNQDHYGLTLTYYEKAIYYRSSLPLYTGYYNDEGVVFFLRKEYEKAKKNLLLSVQVNTTKKNDDIFPYLTESYYHLALYHYTLQDPFHAKYYLDKAAETLPQDHPNYALILQLQAKIKNIPF